MIDFGIHADRGNTIVAGIASVGQDSGVAMVGNGAQKTDRGMTEYAVRVGWNVGWVGPGILANGHNTVVAHRATTGYTRMIKAAVQRQLYKTGGVVAGIAFDDRWHMKFRFTDGQYAIMAFAAVPKYFLMIDKWDGGKTEGCMTGLAHITGCDMIRRFPRDLARPGYHINPAVMTLHATG